MLVKEYRPDLVVLDVMLPDINGKEVCQRVRSDSSLESVKIICISGMVEQDKLPNLKPVRTTSCTSRLTSNVFWIELAISWKSNGRQQLEIRHIPYGEAKTADGHSTSPTKPGSLVDAGFFYKLSVVTPFNLEPFHPSTLQPPTFHVSLSRLNADSWCRHRAP